MDLAAAGRGRRRAVVLFRHPPLWPTWPYLPVVRFRADGTRECGVLYDARGVSGTLGYSATVFVANIFLLPDSEAALFARPKYVYDTAEEIADAGWSLG